jgi:uncharacterized protein YeaO (DUF488 family)
MIRLKRVYDPPAEEDGSRVLVERLWPRGISKEHARIDLWLKDAGASPELRTWFGHDPGKWEEFRRRYFAEMRERKEVVKTLRELIRKKGTVTFVFAAHDREHNNAVALRDFLEASG